MAQIAKKISTFLKVDRELVVAGVLLKLGYYGKLILAI